MRKVDLTAVNLVELRVHVSAYCLVAWKAVHLAHWLVETMADVRVGSSGT